MRADPSVPGGKRAVTRALITAFVAIALVAVIVCVVLMVMLQRVGNELETVREDSRTVREGLSLALSVREHYVHEAHTVIRGDRQQVQPHRDWIVRLRARVADLEPRVPAGEQDRLGHLLAVSEQLDRVFIEEVLPAALAGDQATVQRAHAEAGRLTQQATEDADALVQALEARMGRARRSAERASTVAMITACTGLGVIFLMVVVFSVSIRSVIVVPLQALADTAGRLGRGEEVEPISPLGRGEIATVAHAFDAMAQGIRERERALVESERMAAIGQLSAGIAHEINNPIGIIRGYLKTMIRETNDEQALEELHILDEEAEACQRIVEDLLAFARAPRLELREVDIETLLDDVAARLQNTTRGPSIQVDAEPVKLTVDPVRVRQVVTNLLRNAIDASAQNQLVSLRGEATSAGYRIMVSDRGAGIPPEERDHIFEPFRSQKPGGTGLGLAVSQSIVRAHEGTIEARDRKRGGTEMIVELPLVPRGAQQ